jgi:hypothetical protein
MDEILLNDPDSSITQVLDDRLGSRNVPTIAPGVQAIVAASYSHAAAAPAVTAGATVSAPKRGRPKGSKDKQPRKRRQLIKASS